VYLGSISLEGVGLSGVGFQGVLVAKRIYFSFLKPYNTPVLVHAYPKLREAIA